MIKIVVVKEKKGPAGQVGLMCWLVEVGDFLAVKARLVLCLW